MDRSEEFQAFIWAFMKDHLEKLESGNLPDFHREWTELTKWGRLAIAAPRSFAKSTYFSIFYPLFTALEEYSNDILLISAASNLSEWWLGKITRELESNMDLLNTYGDQRSLVWRQDHIELANGAVIRARGAECKIRGFRPDMVIVDDLESEETVYSEACRNKLSEWFWKTLINVMNPESQLIMIGTLMHPESLLARILREPPPRWETKKYKALLDDGKSIWPSKWSRTDLDNRRAEIGTAAFEQEYQNNPIPEEWRKFNEKQLRYFDKPPALCAYFTTIDPAITIETRSDPDYTAIVTCAVDADKNIYVVEYTRKRMLPAETIDDLLRHVTAYDPEVVGCETVGFQKVLKFYLDEECNRRKMYPFIKELTTGGVRKSYRIERLQPYFEKGKIFIREGMEDLKTELISFPTGKHDDVIDALASIIEIMGKGQVMKSRLPEDCFESWWRKFKRERQGARVASGQYGNHKLRSRDFYA